MVTEIHENKWLIFEAKNICCSTRSRETGCKSCVLHNSSSGTIREAQLWSLWYHSNGWNPSLVRHNIWKYNWRNWQKVNNSGFHQPEKGKGVCVFSCQDQRNQAKTDGCIQRCQTGGQEFKQWAVVTTCKCVDGHWTNQSLDWLCFRIIFFQL